MVVDSLRLLFDFGLVVLIWMVQLIVYPSFRYFSSNSDLGNWHEIYVVRISYLVIPLMFGQLFTLLYQIYVALNLYTIISLFLVLLAWLITFVLFVPRHNTISKSVAFDNIILKELVAFNWWRTALWTLAFVWSLFFKLQAVI